MGMSARVRFSAALAGAVAVLVAPTAGADTIDETFGNLLRNAGAGIGNNDAATLGHSVCQQLSTPASDAAAAAAGVAGAVRKDAVISPEVAKFVAEIAVNAYCPQMAAELASGHIPELPPELSGGLSGFQVPGIPLLPGRAGNGGLSLP